MQKKKRSFWQWLKTYEGQKVLTTILFLLVPVTCLILFTIIPAGNMVLFSFQERDRYGLDAKWVGLENYKTVFSNPDYFMTFKNSIYYLIGSFAQQALALLLASILCSKIKLRNFFKGVLFFPYMMNGVAVSLIFMRFFALGDGIVTQTGTVNTILQQLGMDPVKFLSDPSIANYCLVFISIWRYIGFDIVMYIGAIQSISSDIYEAADLDGANGWQRFRYIVFPSIKPIISLQLILAIKGAVSVFEIPYIITEGKFGTSTFVIKTHETGMVFQKVGLASAMAVVLLIIIIIVTLIQKHFFKENDEDKPSKKKKVQNEEVT